MNRLLSRRSRTARRPIARRSSITKEVVEQCDHLIDLHGGDLDENLRPYSYWTVTGNQKQDEVSRAMVLAFGLDHIIISPIGRRIRRRRGFSRTPRPRAASRRSPPRPAAPGRSTPATSPCWSTVVLNVMGHLKMLAGAGDAGREAGLDREGRLGRRPIATACFTPSVDRDAHVAKGAKIGFVTDYLNRPLQDIIAPEAGIVMFIRARAVAEER